MTSTPTPSRVLARRSRTRARLDSIGLMSVAALAVVLGRDARSSETAGAVGTASNVLGVSAIVGGGYLLVVVALGAIVRAIRAPARVCRVVDRVTPMPIRRLLDLSIATSVVLSATMVGASALPVSETGMPRPTLAGRPAVVGDPSSGQRWPTLPDPPSPTTVPVTSVRPVRVFGPAIPRSMIETVRSSGQRVAPPTSVPTSGPPVEARSAPTTAVPAGQPSALVTREHRVGPGDSFWSIAEDVVLLHDVHADIDDVAAYWRRLMATNRDRLDDPDQPDILHPGLRLRLPDVRGAEQGGRPR